MRTTRSRLPRVIPTPESVYHQRRTFLKQLGMGGMAMAGILAGCDAQAATNGAAPTPAQRKTILRPGLTRQSVLAHYPAGRNDRFKLPGNLTDEVVAGTCNNYYEFTTDKAGVWKLCQDFDPDPWTLEITGLCNKPQTFDIDTIHRRFGGSFEERTYRFRCVEAWAMDVPWTGFALGKLLAAVDPKSDARFVRFISVNRPKQMPGIVSQPWYPWPYFEGLRMDEAMNELTMLVTGIYGRPLPRQHGAPFRVVVPWKYGYKSPKSIVRIELVAEQPPTFWEKLEPTEYPFESNVNPKVPHPRWSQASESIIGTQDRRPTQLYNGYGEFVANLYA